MAEPRGPILLVVNTDPTRLQWLSHHVTSRWPDAVIDSVTPGEVAWERLMSDSELRTLVLSIDFEYTAPAVRLLNYLRKLCQAQPDVYCIVLAHNGDEGSAVRALKCGAKDYLPVAQLARDTLLASIEEALRHQTAAVITALPIALGTDGTSVRVPGYSIVKDIAVSNFSAVFLARSDRLRRNVALKVMNRGLSSREKDDAERFQREYEIISSIDHRAIAEIYDFGTLPKHLYLAMEHFPCGDLRDRLRNPLSSIESLYYLRAIAEALRVIHVFGILHRDLKPANVMLREDNSPVLIDFGLARRSMEETDTTGIGQVVGSPYYISPEQSQAQKVDQRTDLYSLGVIFFELLTGQRPYGGRTAMAIMAQHSTEPIPKLPEELKTYQNLINRLMAKQPHERYYSVDELLADLNS